MVPLPGYIDKDAWQGFIDMRAAMPKSRPFTPRAAVLILKELQRIKDAGHDPNAALDQSTLNGWADVYTPKIKQIYRVPAIETTDEWVAAKATAAAMDKARISKPPAAIGELLRGLGR